MKQRFPSDYKSIVVNSLDDFKKYGAKRWALNGMTLHGRKSSWIWRHIRLQMPNS
jgi:hypothetical protein